jgi:DNA-nicking Smr family endonuclease
VSVPAKPEDELAQEDTDEVRLFRDAVRGVRPLKSRAALPKPPRVRPRARFTRADRAAVLKESLDGGGADPEVASGEELVSRTQSLAVHDAHAARLLLERLHQEHAQGLLGFRHG